MFLKKEKTGTVAAERDTGRARRVALASIEFEKYLGRYVGIGDLPLVMDLELKGNSPELDLMDQKLALKKISDYRYRVSKGYYFLISMWVN